MQFRLLGPVEARRDDRPLALGGTKPRALLALLLLHANEVVSRDRIVEALWSDRPPGTAEHSLDVQVSRLRKALAPDDILVTRGSGYMLEAEPDRIDARRFERLLAEGRRANAAGRAGQALETLEAALDLWHGNALGDLAYEEFARAESERLDELRLVATEERIDAELVLGRQDTAIPELEALVARHPLRERPRAQLMLALYRAGRQAEALRVYADTRTRLAEELGIEPGTALKELEQAMLRQDPALGPARPIFVARHRRLVTGAAASLLAAIAVAATILVTQGGAGSAHALAEPDSIVFLAADTGELVRATPARDTVRVAYRSGALWSLSAHGELTRIDPETGKEVDRLGLGIEPSGLAVGEGSVWVTDRASPTLLRVDSKLNEKIDELRLPMKGVVTDTTGEVALGAGSVWIGHGAFNPGAWVEQLDPRTRRVRERIPILAGDVDHLAFADGALWVASQASGGLHKIDPLTGDLAFTRLLQAELCCVAAGGGYAWAATNPAGELWKVTTNGKVLPTIDLGSPVMSLAYGDGALWAALGDEGKVVRVDPVTDETREHDVGHSVTSVDAFDGLIAAGVRHRVEDPASDLEGEVVRVGREPNRLFDSGAPPDPAFTFPTWDGPMEMFHYATCARLLNHPDAEGEAGLKLVPEVAESVPRVSDGGRTFTFRIREGFGFSPPSNEEVRAESFREALERAVEMARRSGVPLAPPLANIVGATAFYEGRARRIAGVSARGRELVFRFRAPQPDFPWLAALTCAVPRNTPVVPGGIETPVHSAGPYYLAALTESVAVLKRNPNYGGSRPQRLDAIVIELGVTPAEAATRTREGTLDYFLESQTPTLRPDTQAARAAGDRYGFTPPTVPAVEFYAFNYERPLFADISMRRAVQYALDRKTLASVDPEGGIPATRLLSTGVVGYSATELYPIRPDLHRARALADDRQAEVFVLTSTDPEAQAFNNTLGRQLAAIGLRMRIVESSQRDSAAVAWQKILRSDLIWGGLTADTADPADYLKELILPAAEAKELHRIQTLFSSERERAALALARRIERLSLLAVYKRDAIPELRSSRLGCIVHQPQYAGIDLSALCVKDERD